MFIVEGMKLRGNSFRWTYDDMKIAKFEYNISQCVCAYIVLAEETNGSYNQLDIYYKK